MAAANESQGLKIAVAAFVTLNVILAVTCYFLYSAYSRSEAQLETERDKSTKAQRSASDALNRYDDFRKLAGTRAEESDPAKAEVTAFFKKATERVNSLANLTGAAVSKAQSSGAQSKDLEDANARVRTVINSYNSEPNKTFMSSMDRLLELLENVSMLNTEMAANYVGLRGNLESATNVAKQEIDVQSKAATDSKTDLETEHNKHEQERQTLLTKVDQLQTDNDKKATQIANLETQLKQLKEDDTRKLELAYAIVRDLRDQLEKQENVLDKPDGHITYVDLERREVQIDITRHQGARPQMKMTVFDAASPGIPTEKPKANIELIQVGDRYSVARIDRTNSTIDPIRVGDIVYSPAWSPEEPMQFALIGKIDVNRDNKDDREELKRMIEDAGGKVVYDLPPPTVGKESGKLDARIAWYVVDERKPLRGGFESQSDASIAAQSAFQTRYGEVVKEARLEGIRPMPIGRLLAYLGYEMGTPIIGRAEAVNAPALRRLVEPRKQERATPPAGAGSTEPAAPQPESEPVQPETDQPRPEVEQPKPE
jgi:hypothetical protein